MLVLYFSNNVPVYLDSKLLYLCKRAFRIIHGFEVKKCDKCDVMEMTKRRRTLAMKLFKEALFCPEHILNHLLPPFSHRSKRIILPRARTKRKTDGFVFSCSKIFNQEL